MQGQLVYIMQGCQVYAGVLSLRRGVMFRQGLQVYAGASNLRINGLLKFIHLRIIIFSMRKKKKPDDEIFEITDFTNATPFEDFVASIEQVRNKK